MTIAALFAHPDDESLLAGGTLAACAALGHRVVIISATAGEHGPRERGMSNEDVAATRLAELRLAGTHLGAWAVMSLGLPDGALQVMDAAVIAVAAAAAMAPLKPEIVISFGTDGLYGHPDHVALHYALKPLVEALAATCSPAVYYATWPRGHLSRLVEEMAARSLPSSAWGLEPADFGAGSDTALREYDVRPFLGRKIAALRSHVTQLRSAPLFAAMPPDLAAAWLGREFFARPANAEADDPLFDAVRLATAGTVPPTSALASGSGIPAAPCSERA